MRRRTSHSNQTGFTLAELLVVIAIIGIMFAITLPALTNITGQTRLEAAANALHSAAKLARQHAVSRTEPTYLLFHDEQTDPELAYRAYAVFAIDISSGAPTQADGYYVKDWETLPRGVVLDFESAPNDNLFNPNKGVGWNGALSEGGELRIGSQTYIVAGFAPKGHMSTSRYWTRRMLLCEGTIEQGALIKLSTAGKEIRIDLQGQSSIIDTEYDEAGELLDGGE